MYVALFVPVSRNDYVRAMSISGCTCCVTNVLMMMLWVPGPFCSALGWFCSVEMYGLRGPQIVISTQEKISIEYTYLLV